MSNTISHTHKVSLKYAEDSFSIHFSSLHFSAPGKNSYKYILEGFDDEWMVKDATDRIAKYTKLPPSKYTFKVIAANNDGVWNNTPKSLEIIVTPPWYLSTLAWIFYAMAFLGVIWFFRRFSLIRIKQKNELLCSSLRRKKFKNFLK